MTLEAQIINGIEEIYTPGSIAAARSIYLRWRLDPVGYADVADVLLSDPEFCDRYPRAAEFLRQNLSAA